jgi:hypothetical protein
MNFVHYQFQIIDHGFLQAHFKAKHSPKNTKGNIVMYINERYRKAKGHSGLDIPDIYIYI